MTTITASDGKQYRPTGEFRYAKEGEPWIHPHRWTNNVAISVHPSVGPVIILKLVQPIAYEVTVRLAPVDFHNYKGGAHLDFDAEAVIERAIRNGNYREVTE